MVLSATCAAFAQYHDDRDDHNNRDNRITTAAAQVKHVFVIVLENKNFSDTFDLVKLAICSLVALMAGFCLYDRTPLPVFASPETNVVAAPPISAIAAVGKKIFLTHRCRRLDASPALPVTVLPTPTGRPMAWRCSWGDRGRIARAHELYRRCATCSTALRSGTRHSSQAPRNTSSREKNHQPEALAGMAVSTRCVTGPLFLC